MSASILEADGISYRASGGRPLVDDATLALGAQERLAIIGPNGAGKTTLLRMLAGFIAPHAGEVRLFGRPLAQMRTTERARLVAFVGQTDQPDDRIRLLDYVGLGRVPHAGSGQAVDDGGIIRHALDRVGLSGMGEREFGTLSGGERQRAQIARALAQEPKLLFLDEPTNHLDPRARGDLLRLVAGLQLAVVAVLHDLTFVPAFATSVVVMNDARVVAKGPPAAVLTPAIVRQVFSIDVLRFAHPLEERELTVFDIPFPFAASQPTAADGASTP